MYTSAIRSHQPLSRITSLGAERGVRKPAPPGPDSTLRLLLLIDLALSAEQIATLGLEQVVSLRFEDLTLRQLAATMPAAVALPLMSRGTDAVQILQHLAGLGYAGPALVFAPPLPNRGLVERELRSVSDQLQVFLTEQPGG